MRGRRVLVTGGAGFIGANLALHCVERGAGVVLFDSLARPGAALNVERLREEVGDSLEVRLGDIRDPQAVAEAVEGADVVYHLAAQVAVTRSVADPRADFEVNALGTLNVLEAVRTVAPQAVLVYASTNKVYGGLHGVRAQARERRYVFTDGIKAIPETFPVDFHSPYGCSKGAADEYVQDYARVYGLRTAVFRQSCIYGPRQLGSEDQGWVAHFVISALRGRPLVICGDGRQVRDLLYVDDLIEAFVRVVDRIETVAGEAFNLGGGPENTISLLELLDLLADELDVSVPVSFAPWRPGDQRVYVSDITKARDRLGWAPRVGVREGIGRLCAWVAANPELFGGGAGAAAAVA